MVLQNPVQNLCACLSVRRVLHPSGAIEDLSCGLKMHAWLSSGAGVLKLWGRLGIRSGPKARQLVCGGLSSRQGDPHPERVPRALKLGTEHGIYSNSRGLKPPGGSVAGSPHGSLVYAPEVD